MPIRKREIGGGGGVTKRIDLTDKEVGGVIDHADGAITSAKIADANVTKSKLGSDIQFSASYLIYKKDATYYAKSSPESVLSDYSGANKDTVIQNAIDAVHNAGGGVIVTKEVLVSETSTFYQDTLVIENCKGIPREFRVLPDTYLYILNPTNGILDNRPSIPHFHAAPETHDAIYKNGYLCMGVRNDHICGGEVYFPETIGYGTYQWKGKIENTRGISETYLGLGEEFPTQYKDSIMLKFSGGVWSFITYKAGSCTSTTISGVDFTVEHTFKVEWALNTAKFYVDSVLKATHTTNVPDKRIVIFMELYRTDSATTHGYIYCKDWQRIV